MNHQNALRVSKEEPSLTVSYKATPSLDGFLQNLPDVVIITDAQLTIRGFNKAAELFFKQPALHFIGKKMVDIIPMIFRQTTIELALQELFASGIWNGEIIIERSKNQQYAFRSTFSLLYDESGSVNSIVLVNHNLSEVERQQKHLLLVENKYRTVVETLSEGVLLINGDGTIGASNRKAAEILGVSESDLKGRAVNNTTWNAIKDDGTIFPVDEFPAIVTLRTGRENNDVVMGLMQPGGKRKWLSINSRPIFNENSSLPDAVVASFKDITLEKLTSEKLKESELLFRSFMTNSPSLAWIYDEFGNFVYGNPLFIDRIGISEAVIGKHIREFSSPQVADKIISRNLEVLEKGESIVTEDKLVLADRTIRYFLANWFLLPGRTKRMVGGQAIDITERKNAEQQINKMNERFTYVVNASSDAIWDLDLQTNEIYRSDAFLKISGYTKDQIEANLDWWFDKIHPDDQQRVHEKIEQQLTNGIPHWEDEYRFRHADGTYRHIYDKGFAIYENGKAIRQIGSMQDITERKKLEAQLMHEHVQKQKLINQATINAQEEERNMISGELHDNVNQLLISSRLYIGVARNNPETQNEMLDKATSYLLMAVDEIRALSKRMNSKVVSSVGLFESIHEIANNMKELNDIDVEVDIDREVATALPAAQQLMVFRIVQEQTGNIVKHAGANSVQILLKQKDENIHLLISDNGKGFDKDEKKVKGIGFINIFNRVDAYNGKVEVITTPGNGCLLDIVFPISNQ